VAAAVAEVREPLPGRCFGLKLHFRARARPRREVPEAHRRCESPTTTPDRRNRRARDCGHPAGSGERPCALGIAVPYGLVFSVEHEVAILCTSARTTGCPLVSVDHTEVSPRRAPDCRRPGGSRCTRRSATSTTDQPPAFHPYGVYLPRCLPLSKIDSTSLLDADGVRCRSAPHEQNGWRTTGCA